MVTEGSVTMERFEEVEKNIDALLRESNSGKNSLDRAREIDIIRSGSAPPSVEGSRAAFGSVFNHNLVSEEVLSNPAYFSYYSSNRNLNPRLPAPVVANEGWIMEQRMSAAAVGGAVGDQRRSLGPSGGSPFSPGILDVGNGREANDWVGRGGEGLIGLGSDIGLGIRRKSFADALQVQTDFGHSAARSRPISRPSSRNAFENAVDRMGGSDLQQIKLYNGVKSPEVMHPASSQRLARVQSLGSSMSQSFASDLVHLDASLTRSMIPDPQVIRRSPSPCLAPVGSRMHTIDKRNLDFSGSDVFSSHMADCSDMAAALAGLKMSKNIDGENYVECQPHQEFTNLTEPRFKKPGDQGQYMQQNVINKSKVNSCHGFPSKNGTPDHDLSNLTFNEQIKLSHPLSSNNLYKIASGGSLGSDNYPSNGMSNVDFTTSNSDAYSANHALPSALNSQLDAAGLTYSAAAERHQVNRAARSGFHMPNMDPLYTQYLQDASDSSVHATGSLDPSFGRNYHDTSHMDLSGYSKAYLEALLAQQNLQYGMPLLNKSRSLNHCYYDSPFGLGMQYPASPVPSSVLSFLGPGSSIRPNERLSPFPSMTRDVPGGSMGSWNTENGHMSEAYASSLLEEFKTNKTKSFELSEIVNHVVEFSADQYGSRFIQQKLETASVEEKNKIFPEVLPHARALMTDVFGNYVIQKFLEHGTEIQRKELASQLMNNVLPLSLQMYGCRVIQKALEVVDIDQQTQMVSELDGSIMKCVRDQNGNHVIQKCIECVPQERIQFIISAFYGQVVALSTHPYGCRVIQRVLEHCDDEKTQSIMMKEILDSVCTLAQDQYGNYVVQHVLQHGKPEERSAIISKLAGQIVIMSQQKFASNVVEKCLTHGSPEERQLLIDEMLGTTDENEPLQAMMKDQFANYVVQKVLETCDDHNRELILSRIRVHLNVLKRYTYGKHIVPRVEKLLILAGERRSGLPSHSSS